MDRPLVAAVVVVPPSVAGVVAGGGRRRLSRLGDTSGEKMPPSAYSDRFSPYCFTRCRLTSMISTSTTISARGLSFCWMIFSKIRTIGAVARIVIEFAVLFGAIAGWTATPGGRNAVAEQLRHLGGVGVRQVERLDHLVVVLRVLLRVVVEDEDRPLARAPCTTAGSR